MVVFRPQLDPTVGLPQPVALQAKQRIKMNNPQFYQQQPVQSQPHVLGESPVTQPQVQNQQQQPQQPSSQDFIVQQLQKYAQRPAVPELDPSSRVQSPNMELVQPSNFQTFYDRLSSIRATGDNMLGASQAKSMYQRMQQAAQVQQAGVAGGLGSSPIGYKNTQAPSSGPGKIGSGVLGSVPSNPRANFQYAQNIAGNYGWGSSGELGAWYQLGMKESGWNSNAQNPTSTAYGIGQFLNSTWGGYGIQKTSDPSQQVEAMARYIKARYGSPSKALAFHNAHNWY